MENEATDVNVIIQEKKSNGLGTAGFVLSILAILLCWIPIVDWILWFLGALFSVIGVFKRPRGLAIAGIVISFICIIVIIVIAGAVLGAASSYLY